MVRWVMRSLFRQLMLTFLGVGLASFGVNALLTLLAGQGSLQGLIEQNMRAEARSVRDRVQEALRYRTEEVTEWAHLPALDEILIDDRALRIENLLIDLRRRHAAVFAALSVLDRSGKFVASTRVELVGMQWPEEEGLPIDDPGGVWVEPIPVPGQGDTFVIAHPAKSTLREDPIGWLVAEVWAGPIRSIVSDSDFGRTAEHGKKFMVLTDGDSRLLAGGGAGLRPETGVPATLATIPPGETARVDLGRDGEHLVTRHPVASSAPDGEGLAVVTFWNSEDAGQATRRFFYAAIGAGALGLTLATGASFLIARRLSRRLRSVGDGIARLAAGDTNHRVHEKGKDEIGQLARSFNSMAERLRRTMGSLERSRARWQAIVTNAPDTVMTVGRDGEILSINRVVPGLSLEEVTGSSLYDYLPARHRDEVREILERLFAEGQDQEIEVEGPGPYQMPAWYSMRLAPIRQGDVIVAAGCIATDVSEKRRLERQILQVSEEERERIGQDLHDGVGQVLTGTSLLARGLRQKLEARGLPEAVDAKRIGGLLNDAIEQTRALARGLFPVGIASDGLRGAFEEMAATVESVSDVTCRVEGREPLPTDDRVRTLHLFRIVQEAVNNALRHSGARTVSIRMINGEDRKGIVVVDDGVGIHESSTGEGRGMGLHLMRYRARVINASIEIRSREDGKGTEVACWL